MNTVEVPFRTKIRSTKMDKAARINFLPFLAHTEIWRSHLKGNEHFFCYVSCICVLTDTWEYRSLSSKFHGVYCICIFEYFMENFSRIY